MKKIILGVLFSSVLLMGYSEAIPKPGTGLTFDDKQYSKVPLSAPLMRGDYANLPDSISLKKFAPTPGNQGTMGTCVSWATAYGARTILSAMKNNLSEQSSINETTFSPSYVYNQIRLQSGCQYGTHIDDALELLKLQGVPKYKDFGYDCDKTITDNDKVNASSYKIGGYKKLFDIGDPDKISLVKKSLSENKPIVMGMRCCTPSFYGAYGQDIWETDSFEKGEDFGHALAVIGYDNYQYGGSFYIMNSWGTTWGKDGFIWMRYDDFQREVRYAYEVIEAENTEKLSGELRFKTSNGQSMDTTFANGIYEMKNPYYSGTLFQLQIANNEPAYVYAFGSDDTQKSYQIFPYKENISPFLGYKSNNVAIPDEKSFVKMDKNIGTDYFCVLYSNKELDLKNIMANMESETGDFSERLGKVLGSDLVKYSNISYSSSDKISFSGDTYGKNVVPIIVKMEHK